MQTHETSFPARSINIDIEPLVESIALGNSIAFVGAGASMSAGLPSWFEFLARCLARAEQSQNKPEDWKFAKTLLDQGDYLNAAELLQRGIGPQLERYIWDEFGTAEASSPIHHAVARIPFSAAITTNYDRLLESAYPTNPPVRTWLDAAAIFSAIRNRRFCVIKTHGDVGNRPSLVLTKTEYRDLIQKNAAFNSCLKTLLSLRTFLFVGYSLRDHDLLGLMDEARLMHGEDFGPHYAILFADAIDNKFTDFLRESYSIHVIALPSPPEGVECQAKFRTQKVVEILRELSGRVAVRLLESSDHPHPLTDSTFTFKNEAYRLLRKAISLTGSFRGEICVIQDEHLHSIERIAMLPPPPDNGCREHQQRFAPRVGDKIENNSVVGRVFLTWKDQDDFAHISNVCAAESQLERQGFAGTTYHSCHPDVLSELACPILSDGQRIGVLNVESNREHSYTEDHLNVAKSISSQVGVEFSRLKQREFASRQLHHYHQDFTRFNRIMRASRLLSSFNMQFILYAIDYRNGELVAHYDQERISKNASDPDVRNCIEFGFRWGFNERSLASLAFRERSRILVPDSTDETERGEASRVAGRGLKVFNIRGPLVSMPISVRGHVAAVLVAWSDRPVPLTPEEFASVSERVHRMAHLLANDPVAGSPHSSESTPTEDFVDFINKGFYQFDKGTLWTPELLKRRTFRAGIIGVAMSCLTQSSIGLTRIRLWRRCRDKFVVCSSLIGSNCGTVKKKAVNSYAGIDCPEDDAYAKYTSARFANDPYARHQHEKMFDGPDRNRQSLDKAENGSWIVAPIVRRNWGSGRRRLRGFLSADSHIQSSDGSGAMAESTESDELRAFQRCAIDVVTDILEGVFSLEDREVIPIRYWSKEKVEQLSGGIL
jgi:hypothetical protein